ncbi:hypothetical protein [Sphingomonas sp.]|uniref:hypothetical protein n=1 Tax=Sphingomonas sp. TaxID=28214 RepID=UPI003B005EFC
MLLLVAALPATLLAPPIAAADPDDAVTRIAARPAREGWFVCDALAGPFAAFMGQPDADGRAVLTLLDRRSGRFANRTLGVGRADPGAGQIHWSLSEDAREVGYVHGVNPGMIEGDGATIAPIKGLTLGRLSLDCRWLSHMRFLGLDARRGVVVTDEGGTLVYRSFDFTKRGALTHPDGVQLSSPPTLEIRGGAQTDDGFRFENGGYVFAIDTRGGLGPASVHVTRASRVVGTDALVGFSYAPRVPGSDTLGPAAAWDGDGVEACRARGAKPAECLIARMRMAGATPASIAFSRRLAARGDAGYISAWRQAGPVGIATVTYPFRANTNETVTLVPHTGNTIALEAWQPAAADRARPDWQAFARAHPDASAWAPGEVVAPKVTDGQPVTIRWRVPMQACHACARVGDVTLAYRFDANGRLLRLGIESVE